MIVNRRSFRYLMTETSKNADFVRANAYFIETSKKMTTLQLFKILYQDWLEKGIVEIQEKNKDYITALLAMDELIVFSSKLINEYQKNMVYTNSLEIHDDKISVGLFREKVEGLG